MKHAVTFLLAVALTGVATAQVDQDAFKQRQQQMREQYEQQKGKARQQYNDARKKAEAEYAAFRKKANEEYAAAVERAWQQMGVQPAVPKPKEPEPPKPQCVEIEKMPTTTPLPQSKVLPTPVKVKPIPLPPIPEPEPTVPMMNVPFYGTSCGIHANSNELSFSLQSLEEKSIAEAWKRLSLEKYDGLLHDCMDQRDALHLSDWGYLQLLGRASEKLLGKGSNEAVLLQMYPKFFFAVTQCESRVLRMLFINTIKSTNTFFDDPQIAASQLFRKPTALYEFLRNVGNGSVFVKDSPHTGLNKTYLLSEPFEVLPAWMTCAKIGITFRQQGRKSVG